jgi:hypothetical protein
LAVEEFFADRQPDDLLLVHFSCHGIKDEAGELYFAMANTLLHRLGATAVAADFVNRRMNRSRSRRVVLLLDCCYAGAFERGMTARAGGEVGIESQFGGRGRAVITASSSMEYAFENNELADTRELAPSVFTSALVEGLETGEADRDQDGLVALDELYDYVYDKVRATTPNQTPGKWTFGVQGDLIIARRSHPVSSPAQLPRELEEAIDSPFAAVRAGAVQELTRLLQGRHAGLVLAARLALEQLTEDDSRTVAGAATAVLTGQAEPQIPPRLELSATAIDFGQLTLNSESPEHRIRLSNAGGGSLNARPTAQADWLRLYQDGEDLVVSVDTGTAGKYEGTATVDSDGGSATIRAQARVVARRRAPAKQDTGTHGESAVAKTADEAAVSPITTAGDPAVAAAISAKQAPVDREPAGVGPAPKTEPVSSVTEQAKTPPDGSGAPGKQPRHFSKNPRILSGASAGIVLIVVLIIVLVNVLGGSRTTPPPAAAGNPTSPSAGEGNPTSPPAGEGNSTSSLASPFREDFSTTVNGWTTASGTGRYSNGTYQISVTTSQAWGLAMPTGVPELSPAPQNVTIEVSAQQIAGGDGTFYGIACRSDRSGNNGYQLTVNDNGSAYIDKIVGGYDTTIAKNESLQTGYPLRTNGTNRLRASCTNVSSQNAVHLVLWVNGTKVLDKTDLKNPIAGGTVGLIVANGASTATVAAEFDNFVVTKT